MAITATYISSTSFSTASDLRSYFIPGRALKLDCGADGIKFGFVDYSAYTSLTTVNMLSSESQAITSNLASVEISSVKPGSANTGCTALESLLMLRGFRRGMDLSYKDTSSFYVDSGSIHIDDGTYERVYTVPSQLTKSVSGLSASTWYHVYAQPPANGLTLTASEITYSTTAPSVDSTKGGKLYHPTDGTKRCVGWIYSNSSSNVIGWRQNQDRWLFALDSTLSWTTNGVAPSNVYTDATANVPIGGVVACTHCAGVYINSTGRELRVRANGSSANAMGFLAVFSAVSSIYGTIDIPLDSNKVFEFAWDAACTNTVYMMTLGFLIPSSL